MEMYSSIDACTYAYPCEYNSLSLHWCSRWSYSMPHTQIPSISFPPPPHLYNQPSFTTPPPNPPFLSPVQIDMISTSINTIQKQVMELIESNSCMLSSFSDMRSQFQEMQLDSTTLDETETEKLTMESVPDGAAIACIDKGDFALAEANSCVVDNSELETEYAENYSRNHVFKVFAEISKRKIAMEVEDSAKGDSVEIVTQVFDKMFQPLSAPMCGLEVREYKATKYTNHRVLLGSPSKLYEIEFDVPIIDFPFDPGSFTLTTSTRNYFHVAPSKSLGKQSAVKFSEIQSLQLSFHKESSLLSHDYFVCVVHHVSANFNKYVVATFPGIYALLISGHELWVLDSCQQVFTQFTRQMFDTMSARERTGIMTTTCFVSPPRETFSYRVTFATSGIVQFLSGMNTKLADYIITRDIAQGSNYCGIDRRSFCLVKTEISQRLSSDFLVDLVGDPGIYSSASINGGLLLHDPSPLSVPSVQKFQHFFMDTDVGDQLVHSNETIVALEAALHTNLLTGHDHIKELVSSNDSILPNELPSEVLVLHDQLNEFLWVVATRYVVGAISGFHMASSGCSLTSCFLNQKELGLFSVPSFPLLSLWYSCSNLAYVEKYFTSTDTEFIASMVLGVRIINNSVKSKCDQVLALLAECRDNDVSVLSMTLVEQVQPVHRHKCYFYDMMKFYLLYIGPYIDEQEAAKQCFAIDSNDAWTQKDLCHVYHYGYPFGAAVQYMGKCSRTWCPLSSFLYTHKWWHVAPCYPEETGVKLSCLFTDAFLWFSCTVDDKMIVSWAIFWTAISCSLIGNLRNDSYAETHDGHWVGYYGNFVYKKLHTQSNPWRDIFGDLEKYGVVLVAYGRFWLLQCYFILHVSNWVDTGQPIILVGKIGYEQPTQLVLFVNISIATSTFWSSIIAARTSVCSVAFTIHAVDNNFFDCSVTFWSFSSISLSSCLLRRLENFLFFDSLLVVALCTYSLYFALFVAFTMKTHSRLLDCANYVKEKNCSPQRTLHFAITGASCLRLVLTDFVHCIPFESVHFKSNATIGIDHLWVILARAGINAVMKWLDPKFLSIGTKTLLFSGSLSLNHLYMLAYISAATRLFSSVRKELEKYIINGIDPCNLQCNGAVKCLSLAGCKIIFYYLDNPPYSGITVDHDTAETLRSISSNTLKTTKDFLWEFFPMVQANSFALVLSIELPMWNLEDKVLFKEWGIVMNYTGWANGVDPIWKLLSYQWDPG